MNAAALSDATHFNLTGPDVDAARKLLEDDHDPTKETAVAMSEKKVSVKISNLEPAFNVIMALRAGLEALPPGQEEIVLVVDDDGVQHINT